MKVNVADDSITQFYEFKYSLEGVNLLKLYNISSELIEQQMKDFGRICLSCIHRLAEQNDVYTDLTRPSDSELIIGITDYNSKIDDTPISWIFANKYSSYSCTNPPADWPDEQLQNFLEDCLDTEMSGYEFEIEDIPQIEASVGERLVYEIQASGADITWHAVTDLFVLDSNIIDFTPKPDDIGEHEIWIKAVDALGNEAYETISLTVAY
jgi:hypothetical protein